MRSLNCWTFSNSIKLKLKINLERKLKPLNLTVVVNTYRNVALFLSTPCQGLQVKMVMLNMVGVLDSGALSFRKSKHSELPTTHNEGPSLIHEKEQQQPQLEVPLRRSTRERRMAIPDDYIMYL
ncbi:hypothetical protein AAG906_035868 [Vitis piasezkii]